MIIAPTADELPAVITAMADGLHADPGWSRIVPDDDARTRALRTLLDHAVRLGHHDGTVLAARHGGVIVGGIVWAAPGDYPRAKRRGVALTPHMVALAARIGARTVRELSRFGQAIDHAFPSEPVWYVQALGVTPAAQGRGMGTALLQPVLEKADATSTPCYLETAKEANTGYYERFGFSVVGSDQLYAGGPPVWRMRRAAV